MTTTIIMTVAVLGGITGGYIAAQTGTAIVKRLWPSKSPNEDKPHPLAPIVGLPAFCAGFFAIFLVVESIARGLTC